jgi:hypothetical protein
MVENKKLVVVGVLAFLFGVLWLYPLLLETGLIRYAWEEMRVLVVGGLIGAIIGYYLHSDKRFSGASSNST